MKRQELKESKEASQNLILESKNEHTRKINFKTNGITLIALVITIVLNSSYLAMERMNKIEKI